MQCYEKHNSEDVDKVDVVLKLFDGRHDELYAKLRHACGYGNDSLDVALSGVNTNKLAIANTLFSRNSNKNTINQEQLKLLNYDNDDVTTMSQAYAHVF